MTTVLLAAGVLFPAGGRHHDRVRREGPGVHEKGIVTGGELVEGDHLVLVADPVQPDIRCIAEAGEVHPAARVAHGGGARRLAGHRHRLQRLAVFGIADGEDLGGGGRHQTRGKTHRQEKEKGSKSHEGNPLISV